MPGLRSDDHGDRIQSHANCAGRIAAAVDNRDGAAASVGDVDFVGNRIHGESHRTHSRSDCDRTVGGAVNHGYVPAAVIAYVDLVCVGVDGNRFGSAADVLPWFWYWWPRR